MSLANDLREAARHLRAVAMRDLGLGRVGYLELMLDASRLDTSAAVSLTREVRAALDAARPVLSESWDPAAGCPR